MPTIANFLADHRFERQLRGAFNFEKAYRIRNSDINYPYYDGDQWTTAEKNTLEERHQQATVLNIIRPTVDSILAIQQQRTTNFQIVGRNIDDAPIADLLTKLIKQLYDESDFDFFQSKSFREALIGGIGWTEVSEKKDDTGKSVIVSNKLPWEEVYIDPFYRRPDGSDARYIIRQVWMDIDQVMEIYPDMKDEIRAEHQNLIAAIHNDFKGVEERAQLTSEANVNTFDDTMFINPTDVRRIAIYEHWYRDSENIVRHVIWFNRVFLKGSEGEDSENASPYDMNEYPLILTIAVRNKKGEPQGIVDFISTIQESINKLQSKYIWTISARQLLVEEGAVEDPEIAKDEVAKPDGVIVTEQGALTAGRVQVLDNFGESQQLIQNIQLLTSMAERVTGVNAAVLGLGGVNARSAQQENSRLIQGASMQTDILENFNFSKKQISKVVLRLVGQFYTDERVIRVTQPNGSDGFVTLNERSIDEETGVKETLNKIDDILEFDVIFKEVPAFNSVRQLQLREFTELAKIGIFPPEFVAQIFMQLTDMPNKQELLQQLEASLQAQQQQQAALQQQQQQGTLPFGQAQGF